MIARFGQKVGGVEVFRSNLNVVMDHENNLVAVTGYLSPHDAVSARLRSVSTDFPLSAADAVARAFKDMTDTAISARSLTATGTQGDYTQFSFETPTDGTVRLAIYDLSGAEVVRVLQTSLPSGTHHTTWDGRDREGRLVAGGIYVARLFSADGERARKILKIR